MLKNLMACGFVVLNSVTLLASLSSTIDDGAGVRDEGNITYKEFVINFDNAENINVTISLTAEVDACNHHGIFGDVYPIHEDENIIPHFYIAELSIFSTEMYCSDRSLHNETFSKTFVAKGPSVRLLAPVDAQVTAEPAN